jgi:hypothetical protein
LAPGRFPGTIATMPPSLRTRLALALSIGASLALVGLAVAKPAPPKPPKGKPDAAVETGPYDDASATAPPTGAAASDAGTVTAMPVVVDGGPIAAPLGVATGDGGVKSSPLTPAPNEFPTANPLADAGVTVDYDKIMGDIAALRARAAAVGDTLFHSRIAISLETDGSHAKIGRLVVSLDDGPVYTAKPDFRADDMSPIYAHALAPGRHALSIDIDRKDDRNDGFKSSQRSRFIVDVPRDQELSVELQVDDDSSMGKDFPSDQSGRYDLRVRMKAKARAIKK